MDLAAVRAEIVTRSTTDDTVIGKHARQPFDRAKRVVRSGMGGPLGAPADRNASETFSEAPDDGGVETGLPGTRDGNANAVDRPWTVSRTQRPQLQETTFDGRRCVMCYEKYLYDDEIFWCKECECFYCVQSCSHQCQRCRRTACPWCLSQNLTEREKELMDQGGRKSRRG